MAGTGAERRWPMECARGFILVAIVLDVFLSSVPQSVYMPADVAWSMPSGWQFMLITFFFSLQGYAGMIAASMLPLVACAALPHTPRWALRVAVGLTVLFGVTIVLVVLFNTPPLANLLYDSDFLFSALLLPLTLLNWVPFTLLAWIGALALIFALCLLGQSRAASLLATLGVLAALGLGLANADQIAGINVKGLVFVVAALWLWLATRRPGTLPRSAHPWLAALMILWLLPEISRIAPQVIEALGIHGPAARWRAISSAVLNFQGGIALGQYAETLLILLILHQIRARPSIGPQWPWAVILALGLSLPVIIWNFGVPGGVSQVLEALRFGVIGTPAAVLGVSATALRWGAVLIMVVAAIWLVRQPTDRAAP